MNFARRLWTSYNTLLQTPGWKSLSVKSLTSAVIVGGGDVACQVLVEKRSWKKIDEQQQLPLDISRVCRFTFLGGAFIAPTLHVWYGFLGRSIHGSGLRPAVKRMLCDQVLFAPAFIGIFFCVLAAMEGKDRSDLERQLKKDWPTSVVANWKLWVPAQLINFSLVPVHLQVISMSVILNSTSHMHEIMSSSCTIRKPAICRTRNPICYLSAPQLVTASSVLACPCNSHSHMSLVPSWLSDIRPVCATGALLKLRGAGVEHLPFPHHPPR
jgi:hypothetical protein